MYLKINGNIDGYLLANDLANTRKISKETIIQLMDNGVEFVGYELCAKIDMWKEKADLYDKLHPVMNLNEDWVSGTISSSDLDSLLGRFMYPLDLSNCELTIVDPYIFASRTNVNLLVSILDKYVLSKKVRFITKNSNSNSSIENTITTNLQNLGFSIRKVNDVTLHDRWWFSRKEGFVFGTSFNGLQRKDTTCKMLDANELTNIISKFGL